MALNTKTPMQIIQALSISKVNTRRISEATEHLARQRIVIERISEAKKVYEEQCLLSMGIERLTDCLRMAVQWRTYLSSNRPLTRHRDSL